jgi:hypothetical protein
MRKLAVSVLSTIIITAGFTVSPAHATTPSQPRQSPSHREADWSRKKYGAIMPDAYYDQISRCETSLPMGAPFKAGDKHSNYTSSMGIHKRTALRWGGGTNLNNLTARQLSRVADRIAFAGWTNRAGEFVWPVGPFGWATVRHGCGDTLHFLCHSPHKRVQKYRARACRLDASS